LFWYLAGSDDLAFIDAAVLMRRSGPPDLILICLIAFLFAAAARALMQRAHPLGVRRPYRGSGSIALLPRAAKDGTHDIFHFWQRAIISRRM
jgi:hypothetical protein